MNKPDKTTGNSFYLILIKPSHYDDDGYVIQWVRSSAPSNTLATLYGLSLECAERRVLGEDVEIKPIAYDETNTRIKVKKLVKLIRDNNAKALVCLAGVQSNQYPRAVDIAQHFCAAGIPVCIGGFHVSGTIAMLPTIQPELQQAMDLGISLFAGELEDRRFDQLIKDAYNNQLQPLYNHMDKLPEISGSPPPFLPASNVKRIAGNRASFDAGRGCPYLCSFCTIINVQGRKSRNRSADDVERIVKNNLAQGVGNFFITDDNFARNQEWEAIFDRLIHLREVEKLKIKMVIQVDTMCHKIPGFIEKAGRAGVNRVFIGLESINPDVLKRARKGQNRITEYRGLFQAWHDIGAFTYAGYIIGFPDDTPETIERDIKIIQRELPVDILEFFILTPLPGSQDHKELFDAGVALDPDLNSYDTEHVVTPHPTMSDDELKNMYHKVWDIYYTPQHIETIIRRSSVWGKKTQSPKSVANKLLAFYSCIKLEKKHPLEGGIIRRKYRRDRRPNLPLENPVIFYCRYTWEMIDKYARALWLMWTYKRILRRVEKGPAPSMQPDIAMIPVQTDELEKLDIYTATQAAIVSVKKIKNRRTLNKRAATL